MFALKIQQVLTHKFIKEVELHPSTCATSCEDYSKRQKKKKCWEELDLFGKENSLDTEMRAW